jgi:acid phosphatase (class A)
MPFLTGPSRFLLVAALLLAGPAFAEERPFLTSAQVDLLVLLPPPPADNGPDLAAVLAAQSARTPERIARAIADAKEAVFDMYGSVLGEKFAPGALPLTAELFARLGETEDVVVGPAKGGFGRKRPYLLSSEVHPALRPTMSGSYPSGHATRGTLDAIVLAAMVPEQRPAIFARLEDYTQSRIIGGMHFPSDIEAGKRAGTAIAAVLFNDSEFGAEFASARRELRAALGLPG